MAPQEQLLADLREARAAALNFARGRNLAFAELMGVRLKHMTEVVQLRREIARLSIDRLYAAAGGAAAGLTFGILVTWRLMS
jgi:hypothetical protein